MDIYFKKNRIEIVLGVLKLSASALTRECGVDTALINKWRRGERKMTDRSSAVKQAAGLVRLDSGRLLEEFYAPYRTESGTDEEALAAYLTASVQPGLDPRDKQPRLPSSGEFTVEHAIYLGQRGFRKGTLAMLDYLMVLPPGQTVHVIACGRFDLFIKNIPFMLSFVTKLKKAITRGSRLLLVNRKGYSIMEVGAFTLLWLVAHMKGYIRSRYYDGDMPDEMRYLASIPGYWSGKAEDEPEKVAGRQGFGRKRGGQCACEKLGCFTQG